MIVVNDAPVVYLLHGEDEYAIAQFVSDLESKLGDPATAAMNNTHLDGRTYHPDELLSVASTMPFLAKRRLVVLTNPTEGMNSPVSQKEFTGRLERIPPTTALVLVEYKELTTEKNRREGKLHWLEKWAVDSGERTYIRKFDLPKGGRMGRWIQERARSAGGKFTPRAADLLGSLVDESPRMADQEIHKLLAYVNYQRPVDVDDVENLTPDASQGNVFVLVDSLGNRDGRKALKMLRRLLEKDNPQAIFGMIVRQFRLLLWTREMLDGGAAKKEIIQQLRVQPFVVDKLMGQARHFSMTDLEMIYHRLLEVDESVKTGRIKIELALETLVVALTQPPVSSRNSH